MPGSFGIPARRIGTAKTFKVESKRADKQFPMTSPVLSGEIGGYLLGRYPHLSVDVHAPELIVRAEVRDFAAYVHSAPKPGAGGFPIGTGGKAVILISGGIDSPVAAWMMARRGVELTAVHFASPPYTSERAEQKVVELLRRVAEYGGHMVMQTVGFTRVQEAIMESARGIVYGDYAAVYGPRCGGHRPAGKAARPGSPGEPRAGGKPDDAGDRLYRCGGWATGVPAIDWNGQKRKLWLFPGKSGHTTFQSNRMRTVVRYLRRVILGHGRRLRLWKKRKAHWRLMHW